MWGALVQGECLLAVVRPARFGWCARRTLPNLPCGLFAHENRATLTPHSDPLLAGPTMGGSAHKALSTPMCGMLASKATVILPWTALAVRVLFIPLWGTCPAKSLPARCEVPSRVGLYLPRCEVSCRSG